MRPSSPFGPIRTPLQTVADKTILIAVALAVAAPATTEPSSTMRTACRKFLFSAGDVVNYDLENKFFARFYSMFEALVGIHHLYYLFFVKYPIKGFQTFPI